MLNKIILIVVSIFIIVVCTKKEPAPFYKKLDFNFDKKSYFQKNRPPNVPPPIPPSIISYYDIILPVKHNDKKFDIVIENIVGRLVYEEYYKNEYDSYALFLMELSSCNLIIPAELINQIKYTQKIDTSYYGYINPNDTLLREYKQVGFDNILKKYFTEKGVYKKIFRYSLNADLNGGSYKAMHKLMYENHYLGITDCVSGSTYFFRFLE